MKNIVLIGMPSSGKSTVGVLLAKRLGLQFIDTDLLLQQKTGSLLHETIATKGHDAFLALENSLCADLAVTNTVIATGGSVVYGKEAMEHLKKTSTVVYLKVSYEDIEKRLKSLKRRGVVFDKGQTLRDIYEIRTPLYEKYADIVIDCNNERDIQETALEIADRFEM